jgi:N-acetylneuraminic acid mutarotase
MKRRDLFKVTVVTAVIGIFCLAAKTRLNAQTLVWKDRAAMPVLGGSGRNSAVSFTIGGKVYAGGGNIAPGGNCTNSFYEYDTGTNVWTQKADLPGATDRSSAVTFTIGGKGYMGLGVSGYFGVGAAYLNDLWEYDPIADVWISKAPLPDTGRGNAGCFVLNEKAYVVGGQILPSGLKTAETWEYNPSTNSWAAKAAFPGGSLVYPFAFSGAGKGYISCGSQNLVMTNKSFKYDPIANTWTSAPDFPGSKCYGGVSFTLNGKSYCGLGSISGGTTDTFYAYDASINTWGTAQTNFVGPKRSYPIAAVVGSRAYLGCGWVYNSATTSQTFYNDWYRVYDSASTSTRVGDIRLNNISIFPNPANGTLNITIGNGSASTGTVVLFNLVGRQLIATNWLKGSPVDISLLPAGNYLVRLETMESVYYDKIVVQK